MARMHSDDNGVITHAVVRMYRMGTGDCFVISFYNESNPDEPAFKMMIDCGTWQGTKAELSKSVEHLMDHVQSKVDVLVVTHEHKDHVYGFDVCRNLFPDDFADEVWLAWAEEDDNKRVKTWKREHGKKKMALAAAAGQLQQRLNAPRRGTSRMSSVDAARRHFADAVSEFAQLHVNIPSGTVLPADYVGGLQGMEEVKKRLGSSRNGTETTHYFKPGEVIEDIPGLPGMRIYVLGPPTSWKAIDTEGSTTPGETYEHSQNLSRDTAFAMALTDAGDPAKLNSLLPFERRFEVDGASPSQARYDDSKQAWRRIDDDWLMAAGSLALRLTSGINNLSLVLAIEFVDSGRVMLFPGDAEYGSWASWHEIDWKSHGDAAAENGKHLTEDLLNRTVFYKVAHHLSHNGTAERLGLEMMTHPEFSAMATLDYDKISSGWKNTMPNRYIVEELLERTHGRLIIMNEAGLPFDEFDTVAEKVKAARRRLSKEERKALTVRAKDLYCEIRVEGR